MTDTPKNYYRVEAVPTQSGGIEYDVVSPNDSCIEAFKCKEEAEDFARLMNWSFAMRGDVVKVSSATPQST